MISIIKLRLPAGEKLTSWFSNVLGSATELEEDHWIKHSTKLLSSDWTRAVHLFPNCAK